MLLSLKDTEKYIYHYDGLPEEFFDLSKNPLEENNLVDEHDKKDIEERRNDVVAWRARVTPSTRGRSWLANAPEADPERLRSLGGTRPTGSLQRFVRYLRSPATACFPVIARQRQLGENGVVVARVNSGLLVAIPHDQV